MCANVLNKAIDNGQLEQNEFTPTLNIFTYDGIDYLSEYNQDPIDLLFLDAWDVVPGTDYAEKHLKAYFAVKSKLANQCFLVIDDTDVGSGGKGRLLIPILLQENWIILYKGRHTVFYRGNDLDLIVGL